MEKSNTSIKHYELTILIHPDMEDNDIDKEISNIKDLISKFGGNIKEVINEGKKRLAYSISECNYATYVFFSYAMPDEHVKELSDYINNNNERFLRYLIINVSPTGERNFDRY